MKSINFAMILLLALCSCQSNTQNQTTITPQIDNNTSINSEEIISNVFASDTLQKHGLFSTEWQDELDKALRQDSTNAYLWQQKSMPLYKQGKYQLGRPFLDKAAFYNPKEYLDYRAFMICIFEKNYIEAVDAFEYCISTYGDNYVMDHSYSFYLAISKIQLNEFEAAEVLLENEIERQRKDFGEENMHFLDNHYLGIARFELNQFEKAIEAFDTSLKFYPYFADAQLYKSKCLRNLGKLDEADQLLGEAQKNGKSGNTISEDNAAYERYPYQVRWKT